MYGSRVGYQSHGMPARFLDYSERRIMFSHRLDRTMRKLAKPREQNAPDVQLGIVVKGESILKVYLGGIETGAVMVFCSLGLRKE